MTMTQENTLHLRHIEEILRNLEEGSIRIQVNKGKITEIDTANTKNQFPETGKQKKLI
jgi:hypothetical protein